MLSILLVVLDSILFYLIEVSLNVEISTSLFKYLNLSIVYGNNLYLRSVSTAKCLVN